MPQAYDSSMFSNGKYEILFCSKPYSDDNERIIQNIQGAEVITETIDLKHKIIWKNGVTGGEIESVNFYIEHNDIKLGQIFHTSPYGIIKKNRTGVGATTLELNAPRNSIIVVPTKSLAFEKAMTGKEHGKYKYLYVGSEIEGMPNDIPSIPNYLSDKTIAHKKFLVVADSLPRIIEAIGEKAFHSYFIMIDEIDLYQSDSTYRPALENVIDYYFQFDYTKRCMVSATIREFSNPQINEESVIEIEYLEPQRRDINLINTDNPNAIAQELIEKLFYSTQDKIVIAYNKIKFIRQIIQNLREECRDECAILCSSQSIHHAGKYYTEIADGHLQKRITFLTCSFFAGIDIYDEFNLLSISNVKLIYTLLSPDRYTQIAGRCRPGLLSETIIYTTKVPDKEDKQIGNPKDYRTYLLDYSNDLKDFINHAKELEDKYLAPISHYKRLLSKQFSEIKQDIIRKTKKSYFGGAEVSLVRQNQINKEFQTAYFIIDSIYESVLLKKTLYTTPDVLLDVLAKDNNIVDFEVKNRKYTQEQKDNDDVITEEYNIADDQNFQDLVEQITNLHEASELNDDVLTKIQRNAHRDCKDFVERFKRLYKFIPFERLISNAGILASDKKTFRGYNNSAIFWALAEDHPFKADMRAKFKLDEEYTNDEIKDKIANAYWTHFRKGFESNIHVNILGEYMKAEIIDARKNNYKISSYNMYNFSGKPIREITEKDSLIDLLEFSSGVK